MEMKKDINRPVPFPWDAEADVRISPLVMVLDTGEK